MSKKHHKNNIPLYCIRRILRDNVVDIDNWHCYQLSNDMFDIYFRSHANVSKSSVQFIVHNDKLIISIKYKDGKPDVMFEKYETFDELDDIISNILEDLYHLK